jgi:hypothetical protein
LRGERDHRGQRAAIPLSLHPDEVFGSHS